jgi:hypothetical protein
LNTEAETQYINKDFEETIVEWLRMEIGSETSLSWAQLHAGLTKVAEEHGHTITDCMWHDFNYKFNEADENNDGVIDINELEVAYERY